MTYQDGIIGSLAAGWAIFFGLAAVRGEDRRRLDGPIAAGFCTIAGLAAVTASSELPELAAHRDVHALQLAGLAAYWIWLLALRCGTSRVAGPILRPDSPRRSGAKRIDSPGCAS